MYSIVNLISISFIKSFRIDRKSTRLNSSHSQISYAVFCLKKKTRHLRSDLVALASWTTTSKLADPYGNELNDAIAALFCQINLDDIDDAHARAVLADRH